jgi:putative ABC transport system permease protein
MAGPIFAKVGQHARSRSAGRDVNLALKDINHNLGRFLLTCLGLSLLLGIVLAMIGIYRGLILESLGLVRAAQVDVWVVEGGTRGPFAESSRIPGDTREAVASQWGVAAAGAVAYQNIEAQHRGESKRLLVVGAEIARPGEAPPVVEGRPILRSRYEAVADRRAGLALGERITMGRDTFTVVGMTENLVASGGDPVVFITLRDAQKLQFDLTPAAARRELARALGAVATTDMVNAVLVRLLPSIPGSLPTALHAGNISRRSRRSNRKPYCHARWSNVRAVRLASSPASCCLFPP